MIKLIKLLEMSFKVNHINRLVEQVENLKNYRWNGYYVIGPDKKFWKIGGRSPIGVFHGYALEQYPKFWNEALEKYKTDEDLIEAIEAGSEDLYRFMYDRGFIRGGDPNWISFNKETTSKNVLMIVLYVAKANNLTKINVNTNNDTVHNELTIDEFIEKFL